MLWVCTLLIWLVDRYLGFPIMCLELSVKYPAFADEDEQAAGHVAEASARRPRSSRAAAAAAGAGPIQGAALRVGLT